MEASELKTRRFWLVALLVAGVFAIVAIDFLRGMHLKGAVAGLVLGSAPNFFAAASLPAATMCWRKKHFGLSAGVIGCFVAQVIVLGWEIAQTTQPGMVFDTNDLGATVLGGLLWASMWPWLDRSLPAA